MTQVVRRGSRRPALRQPLLGGGGATPGWDPGDQGQLQPHREGPGQAASPLLLRMMLMVEAKQLQPFQLGGGLKSAWGLRNPSSPADPPILALEEDSPGRGEVRCELPW